VFAAVLILALVVVGLFSYPRLGVDRFPNIDFPAVTITTTMDGAAPEEMDTEVVEEIEKQVSTVSGIDTISSVSSEGISVQTLQFVLEKNGDTAAEEVRSKIDLAVPHLPDRAKRPIVQKFSTDAAPILSFTLSSDTASIRELSEYADKTLSPQITSIDGVGQAQIVGGRLRQINVLVDPYQLRAFDLTVSDVEHALQTQNLQVPGGSLQPGALRLGLRTVGRVQSIAELRNLVVKTKGGRMIHLSDVAMIRDAEAEPTSLANVNGKPAVRLDVRKQSGANSVAVIDAVKAALVRIAPTLPQGYRTQVTNDQSVFIKASLHAVQEHLILGSFLAALVVLLFLWNWRSTVIAALAIPSSIIATFTLIAAAGFTLNMMTMLALTLAIGIVIDDAIIVLENIYRFIEEKGISPREAAIQGTQEIGLAVLATTLSLVAVFLPVAFMTGIVGRFLSSFGLTMTFAIMISLLVAFTLTPMLSSRWLSRPRETLRAIVAGEGLRGPILRAIESQDGLEDDGGAQPIVRDAGPAPHVGSGPLERPLALLQRVYGALLGWSLRHRWVIVVAAVLIFYSIVPLGRMANANFLPDDDESQFLVSVRAAEGWSLAATEALLNRIAADIRRLPEVRFTAVSVGNDAQQTQNKGEVLVQMNTVEKREGHVTQFDLMQRTRSEILGRYPRELRTLVSPPNAFGGGAQAGIAFVVTGPDLDQLARLSEKMVTGMGKISGLTDADTSLFAGNPELRVTVDRSRAADLGVSVSDVASALRILVAGENASDLVENGHHYDVNLRALPQYRQTQEDVSLFTIPSANDRAAPVSLDQVVTFAGTTSPSVVNRYARARSVTLSANLKPGASQQAVQNQIEQMFKAQNLGPQYQGQFSGNSRELARTFASFITAIGLSFAFMYLILAAQFESWLHPVTILLSLPLTVPFAVLTLLLTGNSINLFSLLGVLVLFGIVKKNSILQVDHANHLREQGMERTPAILQGSHDRLRPILMTTIAFVAGMLPLAVSSGTGAGTNRAISWVIIGGQMLALLLTLVATPVFYSLFDDLTQTVARLRARFTRSQPESEPAEPEPIETSAPG
jgi:HAE1 family hydrophobic/amphiphilic exporter-1